MDKWPDAERPQRNMKKTKKKLILNPVDGNRSASTTINTTTVSLWLKMKMTVLESILKNSNK